MPMFQRKAKAPKPYGLMWNPTTKMGIKHGIKALSRRALVERDVALLLRKPEIQDSLARGKMPKEFKSLLKIAGLNFGLAGLNAILAGAEVARGGNIAMAGVLGGAGSVVGAVGGSTLRFAKPYSRAYRHRGLSHKALNNLASEHEEIANRLIAEQEQLKVELKKRERK